jgi:hypothetical protein
VNVEWKHRRLKETPRSTAGELLDERSGRLCALLEDGAPVAGVKVPGKTRIPAARYELVRREDSPKFAHYLTDEWSAGWFRGMPHYVDVKGDGEGFEKMEFKYVMLHPGNKVEHTDGCPLTGENYFLGADGDFEISGGTSRAAFKRVCLACYALWDADHRIFVTVSDIAP